MGFLKFDSVGLDESHKFAVYISYLFFFRSIQSFRC